MGCRMSFHGSSGGCEGGGGGDGGGDGGVGCCRECRAVRRRRSKRLRDSEFGREVCFRGIPRIGERAMEVVAEMSERRGRTSEAVSLT